MKYEVLKPFSPSGQKSVFLINHPTYGKCIFKKIEVQFGTTQLERAIRECSWQKSFESPYYPKNISFGLSNDGKTFEIFEEFISGDTFSEIIHTYKNKEAEVIILFLHLIHGLKLLWEKQHIHRDLKPANLIINEDGIPIILDLGITKFSNMQTLTNIGHVPHTPLYASPEQLLGLNDLVSHKSDFFSLGIIILECFLGEHPFGNNPEYIKQGKYITNENMSLNFKELIKILLEKESHKRFRKYQDILKFIEKNWSDLYENFSPVRS